MRPNVAYSTSELPQTDFWLGVEPAINTSPTSRFVEANDLFDPPLFSEEEDNFSTELSQNESPRKHGLSPVMNNPGMFKATQVGKKSVNTLQEWEGYVDRIGATHFEATLADITNEDNEAEIARIPIDLLDEDERPFLKMGAAFNLIVGLSRSSSGSRQKDTVVYFRKVFCTEINQGKIAADLLRNTIFD